MKYSTILQDTPNQQASPVSLGAAVPAIRVTRRTEATNCGLRLPRNLAAQGIGADG